MRATKRAIAQALADDAAVLSLVPAGQVFAVERSTIPQLPAIEVIGVSSERIDGGPMLVHELSVECTVTHAHEDGADLALDGIVAAVRARLFDAERGERPIDLPTRAGLTVELKGTRWSVTGSAASGVVRGASVAASVLVSQ